MLPAEVDGTGELYLAHDYTDLRSRQALTLEEAAEGPALAHASLDFRRQVRYPALLDVGYAGPALALGALGL